MKKTLATIFIIAMILTVGAVTFVPHQAHAGVIDFFTCVTSGINCASGAADWFIGLLAEVGNRVMSICGWFLSLMGVALNISILLTLNIKALYQATPAIDAVWVVVRNLSSIFVIFTLLYASIMTILGLENGMGKIIKSIVIAGLLINFSLFFTKVLIDASNLVSMQFYRAIAPTSQVINYDKDGIKDMISKAFSSGGLSDVFMQSLKIPKIYNNKKGTLTSDSHLNYFTITVSTLLGSGLIIIAALSFLAAAVSFIVRVVMLLLLMGFSPVYFAGMIFPQIKGEISDRWLGYLQGQLTFMPVYLLFMYIALRFISGQDGGGFFQALDTTRTSAGGVQNGSGVLLSSVGLIIQYTIAIILINIPLIAAQKSGGMSIAWGESAKKWVHGKLKQGSGSISSYAGRKTIGRVAGTLDKKWENTTFGNSAFGRNLREVTTNKIANVKFGGSMSYADDKKLNKEIDKKQREIDNSKNLKSALAAGNHTDIKKIIGKMSSSEIAALDKDLLSDKNIVQHLSGSVYSSVEKGDKSDADKEKIREARANELVSAVAAADTNKVRGIMKNMSGEDIQTYIEEATAKGVAVLNFEFLEHLKPSQLKNMEGLDKSTRKAIGDAIVSWSAGKHPALDHINKNKTLWGQP